MNFCINCGEKQIGGAKYCSNCGLKLDVSNESEVTLKENQSLQSNLDEEIINQIEITDNSNEIIDKILYFFKEINGKKLLIYNLCITAINYLLGYYIGFMFGMTFFTFSIFLFLDLIIGGAGFWFRSNQFRNGRFIFCIWAIGLILSELTQVNEILFHFTFLAENKYFYFLFKAPAGLYLIFMNRSTKMVPIS